MANLDIKIEPDLHQMLNLPPCDEIKLPFPAPAKIHLPTGGTLQAFTDISKGIPTDCSMNLSLMLQLAPFLGSIECLMKVLKLLKPLIDIVNGLPVPPVKAVQEFAKAAVDLAPCLLVPTPANMIPFVRDILCLILRALTCFLNALKTVLGVMSGLSVQLALAQSQGNTELTKTLQCAQENAAISAQHLTSSFEPITALLDLVGPFMALAGVQPIQLPALGSATDIQSLNQVVQTVQGVVGTLQVVVDALGGCQ